MNSFITLLLLARYNDTKSLNHFDVHCLPIMTPEYYHFDDQSHPSGLVANSPYHERSSIITLRVLSRRIRPKVSNISAHHMRLDSFRRCRTIHIRRLHPWIDKTCSPAYSKVMRKAGRGSPRIFVLANDWPLELEIAAVMSWSGLINAARRPIMPPKRSSGNMSRKQRYVRRNKIYSFFKPVMVLAYLVMVIFVV